MGDNGVSLKGPAVDPNIPTSLLQICGTPPDNLAPRPLSNPVLRHDWPLLDGTANFSIARCNEFEGQDCKSGTMAVTILDNSIT